MVKTVEVTYPAESEVDAAVWCGTRSVEEADLSMNLVAGFYETSEPTALQVQAYEAFVKGVETSIDGEPRDRYTLYTRTAGLLQHLMTTKEGEQ